MNLLAIVLLIVSAGSLLLVMPTLVHTFQLESYKFPQYLRWVHGHRRLVYGAAMKYAFIVFLTAAVLVWLPFVFAWGKMLLPVLFTLVMVAVMLDAYLRWRRLPSKKPLVLTSRVKRLFGMMSVILLAAAALIWLAWDLTLQTGISVAEQRMYALFWAVGILLYQLIAILLTPYVVIAGAWLALPLEKSIQRKYFREAKAKLASFQDMIKVGITGSYGKTSAKTMLGSILAEKYRTMITPHSYNTPMGVTRVIREQLTGTTQVFVAEMGARHVGDIAEMCDLVGPRYGLITSIGPQHLETFHTLERVASTKFELVDALPADGWAFLPSDNDICLQRYLQSPQNKLLFGFEGHGQSLYMTAKDIELGPQGCSFTLVDGDGEQALCTAQVLGRHNIQNILGCAAVARKLGLSLVEIARGIRNIEPVPHRLQLLPTGNGVTIIDDAFNSNPDGTRAALEVLSAFPGRKIIVTPGLVELGDREDEENRIFGRNMASVADIALLVAHNAGPMREGLRIEHFQEEKILCVKNLKEATERLAGITKIGDVVLFENDLPDHYEL